MATYTINQINTDGTVFVTCSVDNKKQSVDNLPTQDVPSLKAALDAYATAYEAGVMQALADSTVATIPATVQALVGQPQTIPGV